MLEIWAAFILYASPFHREIHKEFSSEIDCWNYYEIYGESLFGTQHRDHQNNKPTKDFHFRLPWLNYPVRTYKGLNNNDMIWVTCDIKNDNIIIRIR
jgi:hypothetical protein|tara:strand:+ start:116 stop:406 length:291 start_codon:yes stop_codon:yes gene_type:complete